MSMLYRINAGAIPADTWIQDRDMGGGRIVGEVCHFIDFMIYMNGSLPNRVHAAAMHDPSHMHDTVNISLAFENGSIGSISYFANGPKSLPKEYVEAYKGGIAARLTDFRQLEILSAQKPIRKKLLSQDKGQKAMVHAFLAGLGNKNNCPIPLIESIATTVTTFCIIESLRSSQAVNIDLPAWQQD
jgi:polar amino acid transport system substrate-binding protein